MTNALTAGHGEYAMLFCCLHVYVELRPRIKGYSSYKLCSMYVTQVYKHTKVVSAGGIVFNSQQTVSTCFSDYKLEMAMSRTGSE